MILHTPTDASVVTHLFSDFSNLQRLHRWLCHWYPNDLLATSDFGSLQELFNAAARDYYEFTYMKPNEPNADSSESLRTPSPSERIRVFFVSLEQRLAEVFSSYAVTAGSEQWTPLGDEPFSAFAKRLKAKKPKLVKQASSVTAREVRDHFTTHVDDVSLQRLRRMAK